MEFFRFRPELNLCKRLAVLSVVTMFMLVVADARLSKGNARTLDRGSHYFSETVKEENLRKHLFEIAGDEYEGRGAGYEGERKAAKYIAKEFNTYGLEPVGDKSKGANTYFQNFRFHPRSPVKPFEILQSKNVIGFIKGSDKRLRKEIVVIGCHYDGQGKSGQADGGRRPSEDKNSTDQIWNSADDNGSSVAVLLEIARVVSAKKLKPKRSILFIAFGAEEVALNGSAHYVENPAFKWKRHVAMLNIEKLGRIPDAMPISASGGTSSIWEKIMSASNRKTGMNVKSLIPDLISDTDHYPFAMKKLPAMVVGMAHEEDTHLPTDSPDKISYGALTLRANYVLSAISELANTREKMPFSGDLMGEPGFMTVIANISELDLLGVNKANGGFKVSMIISGSPADKAGLKYGDVIVSLNGNTFKRDDFNERKFFKGNWSSKKIAKIEVIRNGKRRILKLRF